MTLVRRIVLLLCVCGPLARPALSQTAALSLFAGPSTSGVKYGCCASAHGQRSGLTIGLAVRSRVTGRFSLTGGLLRSAKGSTQNEPTFQYSYLELPLLALLELNSRQAVCSRISELALQLP